MYKWQLHEVFLCLNAWPDNTPKRQIDTEQHRKIIIIYSSLLCSTGLPNSFIYNQRRVKSTPYKLAEYSFVPCNKIHTLIGLIVSKIHFLSKSVNVNPLLQAPIRKPYNLDAEHDINQNKLYCFFIVNGILKILCNQDKYLIGR